MTKAVIIEISVDNGRIDYRLWPCGLDSRGYGTVLADVASQIARMMAQEGHLDRDDLAREIQEFFNKEMEHPMSTIVGTGQLQ